MRVWSLGTVRTANCMAGRVEQLRDEVWSPLISSENKMLTMNEGYTGAGYPRWRNCRTRLKVLSTNFQLAGIFLIRIRFCVAPLDVIKIRLQLQIHSLSDPLSYPPAGRPIYKGIFGTLKQIFRDEGLTAFWKGNIPAEGLYLSYGALQFLTYRTTNIALDSDELPYKPNPSARSFISGAFAGTVATTATYPLDLLRTRFAAQGTDKVYQGLRYAIREIHAREGMKGFFRGLGAANAQIVPYMGLFFTIYEGIKPLIHNADLPLDWMGSADGFAGIAASIMSKTAVYPLDTVRKRLQVQGPSRARYVHRNIPEYSGITGTLKIMLKREGLRGMYRGLTVALVKAAPTSAITIWTFERAMIVIRMLDDNTEVN